MFNVQAMLDMAKCQLKSLYKLHTNKCVFSALSCSESS